MSNKEKVGELKTQDIMVRIKNREAEKIALLEEKLKGLKLAHQTDIYTVPVTQVALDELSGVTMQPWGYFWDNEKINPRTPVILGRQMNVIAGPMQYFAAKENGLKQIDAVYIDSLKGKIISVDILKQQFQEEDLCISFAYCLYTAISTSIQDLLSYDKFFENFDKIFEQKNICWQIFDYIAAMDEEFGG